MLSKRWRSWNRGKRYARAHAAGGQWQHYIDDLSALFAFLDATEGLATETAGAYKGELTASCRFEALHHDLAGAGAGLPEIVGHLHAEPGFGC